jgi:hypothetical protein
VVFRIPGPKQQLNHIDKQLIFKRNFLTDGLRQPVPDNCGQSQQMRNLSISDAFLISPEPKRRARDGNLARQRRRPLKSRHNGRFAV